MIKRILKTVKESAIKKIEYDPFLRRIRSSVIGEGMLHEGNIYLMNYAIQNMPEGIVFEIGVYGGLSTNVLLHLLKKNNRKTDLVNCDCWIYEGFDDHKMNAIPDHIDGTENVKRAEYMEYIKESYMNGVQLFHSDKLPYTFHKSSNVFFDDLRSKKEVEDIFGRTIPTDFEIAFAYIDGDHSYEQSKADFENVDRVLALGGFILLDDSISGSSFGSAHLVNDIMKLNNYELIDANPNHLFRKTKS